MTDHRSQSRIRLLDTARVLILLALFKEPRGATPGGLYRRLQAHTPRSSVYGAIGDLALEGFVTSGPMTPEEGMARLAALAPGEASGPRPERTLQLSERGQALARDLLTALNEVGLRALSGTAPSTWTRATWKTYGGQDAHDRVRTIIEHGYPQKDLLRAERKILNERYDSLRSAGALVGS